MKREYYVAMTGLDTQDGSKEYPFRTISRAAELAMPGDTIIVREGEYREWVRPAEGGTSDSERIVYQAAENEKVVIKGSERIQNWELLQGTVWKVVLPNTMFGRYNPYLEILEGDWLEMPREYTLHVGEVYLNGKSMYEAASLEEVKNSVIRKTGFYLPRENHIEYIQNPEDTIYQWFCEADEENTTIYANFQGKNPNEELTEINVRKCCFYPEKTGRNYITVRGFEMAQAACPWTPPTADQPGLLGTNWSKGWIIENNVIHDAKCSGISIGKEISTGHNLCTRTNRKPGYQYQMEAVFRARHIGWSKETIGSHIIRNNRIYDCGQNGIVGHMGCVFSQIYGNHIYNIATKHEFFGYEIAGIKLHAAIDVQIKNNQIHHCTLGTWMDWQAQGVRISGNLYYHNNRDLMVEVTHGPYLVDNNIFASDFNFENMAQGGAYVHNLCCGVMRCESVLNRGTPYHFPHSTELMGTAVVYGMDDRIYQNIFLNGRKEEDSLSFFGTVGYNGCPVSLEEYVENVKKADCGDLESHLAVKQPAYVNSNCYLGGAERFEREENYFSSKENGSAKIVYEEDGIYLDIEIPKGALQIKTECITSRTLGMVRIVEMAFENPDGTELILDRDYRGERRGDSPLPGPLEKLKEGHNHVKIGERYGI